MAENEQAAAEKQFLIQRIYSKDLTLETPNSPMVFTHDWEPEIKVGLDTKVTNLGENNYELVLIVNVEAKHEDKTAFMVEVQQAGIFLLQGFDEQEISQLLGIAAPNILLPYARETVSDLVTRGSFPQFIMTPVNFEAIYQQRMQKEAEAAAQKDQTH